ncbi:MAG: DUF6188 family protein [Kiritimatiellia bacterium]|nr:DUF6188 family protein [Kiritimatiellia bacterium]
MACLVGQCLTAVDSSAGPSWVLVFGHNCSLQIGGVWRVIRKGRIEITSEDHQQKFGLPNAIDAGRDLRKTISSSTVTAAEVAPETGDLLIQFGDRARFEVITDSCGYESWVLNRPDSTVLVATGGGTLVPNEVKSDG